MDQGGGDSSMEELSPDELRMLASKRQEPQGREEQATSKPKSPSCVVGGGIDKKFPNEQKQRRSGDSSSSSPYSSGDEGRSEEFEPNRSASSRHISRKGKKSGHQYHPRGNKATNTNNMSTDSSNSHSAYNTLIIHQNNSSLLADTWIPASHEFTGYGVGNHSQSRSGEHEEFLSAQPRPAHSYSNPYESISSGEMNSALTSSELSEIPRDYLDQLTVLKHLAKEVQQDPISSTSGSSLLRSASFSKSQPDLTPSGQYMATRLHQDEMSSSRSQPQPSRKSKKHSTESSKLMQAQEDPQQQFQHDDVLPSVQILEILMRENAALNAELVNARRKISTIHKLETELNRLQASHEALFASAERRESLERTARNKLSTELKRLTAVNRELLSSGSLQNLSPLPFNCTNADIELLKKEIAKREMTIAQLLSQNKELVAAKERQDIELSAQRATLAEQRTHIDILDSALTNAQANVLRLEEECRKKQEFVDKSTQLQRALSSMQLTNDKREQSEKKVRSQLENEITDLKLRLASMNVNGNLQQHHHLDLSQSPPPQQRPQSSRSIQNQNQSHSTRSYQSPPYTSSTKYESNANIAENQLQLLQEKLKVSEEQIHHLNSQVAKWDHVLTPENLPSYKAQLQNSTSTPNTPNSWTNSNSRAGTPHFFGGSGVDKASMEELHNTNSRANDLEWKLKDLENRLMEKDAVIRILGQTGPSSSVPMYSNSNPIPHYRDSPSYSQASTIGMSPTIQHPISVSMASMMDHGGPSPASLMYSKLMMGQKCESEPPSYANLPLKLRLGGSGSSLVKNSNESLQLGGGGTSTGGNSPNISGPGSVSSASGASGNGAKSIDDQLKELDSQLLSKGGGGAGTLKMHSGLCCIPGFAHSSSATRKGKISNALLESLASNNNSSASGRKYSTPSVLPPKPPSSLYSGNTGSRTTGPPFISPTLDSLPHNSPLVSTTTVLSNSVDSVHKNSGNEISRNQSEGFVFTPPTGENIPKGLPPRPSAVDGKSRSLERNKSSNNQDSCAGKYTVVMYDATRCRSLDRRDLKLSHTTANPPIPVPVVIPPIKIEEKKPEKTKSSVSSKAAFFGQLLTRRSPSPGREKKEKEGSSTPKLGRRFPFGNKQPQQPPSESSAAEDRMLLDKQGRQSQRNRISSKWNSCNTLEAVEEQSGSESPWTSRKAKGSNPSPKPTKKDLSGESNNKKWGRIVKTPFGLRYTFGSPRIAAVASVPEPESSSKHMK